MLRDTPVILWHLCEDRPPADDCHHTAPGVHAAAEFLSCKPFEIYRAVFDGTPIQGAWFADFADPRQVKECSSLS